MNAAFKYSNSTSAFIKAIMDISGWHYLCQILLKTIFYWHQPYITILIKN